MNSKKQDILFHHLVVGTMLIYIANNFLFQKLWPSILTGKLSNFSWLFFTPIVIRAFVSRVLPTLAEKRKMMDLVVWLGIGGLYTLVKTIPSVNIFIIDVIGKALRFPISIVVDATDLLALLSLLLSFYLWQTKFKNAQVSSPRRGLLVLSITALLTIADMAAQDYGIVCFEMIDDAIVASSAYTNYASVDGGETWDVFAGETSCGWGVSQENQYIAVGNNTLQARFMAGKPIEISLDDGKSWGVEHKLQLDTQAQQAYYEKYRAGAPVFKEGPFDALVEPNKGNIVFAMGHEGVLIRKPDKTWQWVTVGEYEKIDYRNPNLYLLLWGEGLLALANGILIYVVLSTKQVFRVVQTKKWKRISKIIFIVIAWLSLGVTIFAFPPAISYAYGTSVSVVAIVGTLFICVMLFINTIRQLQASLNPSHYLVISSISVGLFFLPYLLWFGNLLPNYYFAPGMAVVIHFGMLFWGLRRGETT